MRSACSPSLHGGLFPPCSGALPLSPLSPAIFPTSFLFQSRCASRGRLGLSQVPAEALDPETASRESPPLFAMMEPNDASSAAIRSRSTKKPLERQEKMPHREECG